MLKKSLFILMCIVLSLNCFAQFGEKSIINDEKNSITKEQADQWGRFWVLYNDEIVPLQTLAIDFAETVTGKRNYEKLTPEQLLVGWIYFREIWNAKPIFTVKDKELKQLINPSGKASYNDFFTGDKTYKLADYLANPSKEINQLDKKIQLITHLLNNSLLVIFPYIMPPDNKFIWISQADVPPRSYEEYIYHPYELFYFYERTLIQDDEFEANLVLSDFATWQYNQAGERLPTKEALEEALQKNKSGRDWYPIVLISSAIIIGIVVVFVCNSRLRALRFVGLS